MKSLFAEWLWRLLVLAALGWIGLQLQRLHDDIVAPTDEPAAVASTDDAQDALDEIREEVAKLNQKVDAIMAVMARAPAR